MPACLLAGEVVMMLMMGLGEGRSGCEGSMNAPAAVA